MMKASLMSVTDILGMRDARFVIPVFQRVYSWTKRQCEQLWDDMVCDHERGLRHFMGTIIYSPEGGDGKSGFGRISIIDGQQRLATVTLMLIAFRDYLEDGGGEADFSLAKAIDHVYLHASTGTASGKGSGYVDGGCKLVLSEDDAGTLELLIDGREGLAKGEPSKYLVDNLSFFRSKVEDAAFAPERLLDAIQALEVVGVELGEDDSPQQVFESLNSKGRPLSTTDLLRNTLLARYGADVQVRLFEKYWDPIDDAFLKFGCEQDIYMDAALHFWITRSTPGIHAAKRTDLYQSFKGYIANKEKVELEDMLASISSACLEFAQNPSSPEAKTHLDWATEKPKGMISQRKIFGD